MNGRLFGALVGIGLAIGAVVVVPAAASAQGAVKVDVCHLDDEGGHVKINVAEQALDAHRAHGDAGIGDPVPGMSGYVFDHDCTPVSAIAKAGCFETAQPGRYLITTGENPQVPTGDIQLYSDDQCTVGVSILSDVPGLVWAVDLATAQALCESLGAAVARPQTEPNLYACLM